jgi:macrodomain Ter protein organizer (MatP/YcbG family)
LMNGKNDIVSFISKANYQKKQALEASFWVCYLVTKASEGHTITEHLIDPCINDIV